MIPTKLWYVRTWTVIICYFADHQFCTAWVILKRILIGIYNYTFLPSFATSNQKSCRRQVIDSHQTRFNKFQISKSLRKNTYLIFYLLWQVMTHIYVKTLKNEIKMVKAINVTSIYCSTWCFTWNHFKLISNFYFII